MKKVVIFMLFLICLSHCMCSQVMKSQRSDTLHLKGAIVYNSAFYNNFAVLMRDTTLSGNRFDNWFGLAIEGNHTVNPKNTVTLPAFIIDSTLFIKSEERLLHPDSTVAFYNYSKDNLKDNLRKYIRLYIGYIDTSNQLNVVVQFVTPKSIKKMKVYIVRSFGYWPNKEI